MGQWHVWTTLGKPQGLHFYLDLTIPEQRDVAKELVKMGTKASMAERSAAKATGSTVSPQHLLNLRGNGQGPLGISEDEKLWTMMENAYQTIEFDYAPSPEQMEARKLKAAETIQRSWRAVNSLTNAESRH